jgi:hypothetical protein
MPQLSETQRRRFRQIERESLLRHCATIGIEPEVYLRRRYENGQAHIHQLRQVVAEHRPEHLEAFDTQAVPSLRAADFFESLELRRVDELQIDHLIANSSDLSIEWKYVERLAKNCGFDVTRTDKVWLREFLSFVPHVVLFENGFNAFVSGRTSVDDLPAISTYEHLSASLYYFLEFMFANIAQLTDAGFTIFDATALRSKNASEPFLSRCISALTMMAGMTAQSDLPDEYLASTSAPQLKLPIATAAVASQTFVAYHELAHLLLAHLTRTPGPDLEYEADEFASRLVQNPHYELPVAAVWHKVGALAAVTMIALLNLFRGTDDTHPHGLKRLSRLLLPISGRDAGLCVAVQEAILVACEVAVERLGGERYRIEPTYLKSCREDAG